ncbi:tetratricopeptide repeat protein [Listeria ivanovii]|uniref:Tetratricopeptide repeat protein n=2 Tax=Listeria ivanovii TaxID=1638 RepID=A0ABS1G3G5_LISIV|nr:tetratricopeptide repeat protein [Listeria ivanovii]EFR96412.1 TPR repeat-containing protein YpiA [Listeria ivanovii FSL F6-596]AIS60324.1 TPR repeat-containing protein ypiA [Listeria ivanovii subsp. londoniensis]AIS63148.1 TPR repeat-containing protein ypiA [Listeria ivanovii subsp. londoniensis]MBC2255312.1 tetratricopeptide repeat protein [Listeria ivanovii]MBK1961419.1 tetratricopeptide repeat protein [Listeria ivanovii subsp. londoniensis]
MELANKMLHALEHEDMALARKYFDEVVQAGTDEEQFFLAEELFALGFLDETEDLYELLLAKYKDEGELLVRAAEVALEKDDMDSAQDYLEKVNKEDEVYVESLLVLADLYQMQGLFEVSEQKLLEAKQIAPNEPIIDFALGEYYLSQARFASAVQSYETAVEAGLTIISNGAVSVYERIAEAFSASGAFEEALPYYERALEDKESVDTLFGMGLTAYQAKEYTKAIHALEHLREHDPSYTTLYSYLAKSYVENGEPEKAIAVLRDGLTQDEYNKEMFLEAGKLAVTLRLPEEAEEFYRQAIVLDEEFSEAIMQLNKLLLARENYEGVIELVEGLGEEVISEPQIFWDISVAYQETEQYNKAKANYELAYPHFTNNPTFLKEYGLFLREEGEYVKSEQILRSYLELEPEDTEILSLFE